MKTVRLKSVEGYKPPAGYRVQKILRLLDGTYEVTLEPLAWFL